MPIQRALTTPSSAQTRYGVPRPFGGSVLRPALRSLASSNAPGRSAPVRSLDDRRSATPIPSDAFEREAPTRPMLLRGKRLIASHGRTLDEVLETRARVEGAARAQRSGEAARRWGVLEVRAPEILAHLTASGVPQVVNDVFLEGRDPAYELENCSYCAVGAALRMTSGAVAAEVTGSARLQSASGWSRGGLSLEGQHRGMTAFLRAHAPAIEDHIAPERSVEDALGAMASYPEGTRFVAHFQAPSQMGAEGRVVESHYLSGERVRDALVLADYQTNIAPDARPIIFVDERPAAPHYAEFETASFWALLPARSPRAGS